LYVVAGLYVENSDNVPVVIAVATEGVPGKFQFLLETSWGAYGCGPVYQRGKHSLLVRRMVVRPGIQIDIDVGGLPK
jgi:hypothetical protein